MRLKLKNESIRDASTPLKCGDPHDVKTVTAIIGIKYFQEKWAEEERVNGLPRIRMNESGPKPPKGTRSYQDASKCSNSSARIDQT